MITSKLRAQRPSFRTDEANSTHRLPLRTAARTTGVVAYQLGLSVDGHETLSGISFTAKPGTMTAVIGPSAARNAALLALLAGTRTPSSGRITVDGHDVHAEPAAMRARIGVVSREERLHRRLTVEQALRYAAELRLPPETSAEQRDRGGGAGGGARGSWGVAASHAALLLAQGSGRLLRRVSDRGVVAVLDSRMATAGYGGYLRASLPPFWQTTNGAQVRAALQRLRTAATASGPG
ncbi:ATP-binding cassette domain-containing protein [Mycobacterium avium]|uniref:ATP-binding cassette domain-containing protein n=1 Tax=Mycobacterium avium TaxID=1764 RepID=UPI00355AD797